MKDAETDKNRSKVAPADRGRHMIVVTDRWDGRLVASMRGLFVSASGFCGLSRLPQVIRRWCSAVISLIRYDRAGMYDQIIELERKLKITEAVLASNARAVALTSHDLRTPLNGILGMVDLLARTPLSPEQASYAQTINASAAALLVLVDDMLDAGKLAAGRWDMNPQPVTIEALVEEVVELLAPQAQAKGLEIAAYISARMPDKVGADANMLMRILMNLIGNAIKFTEFGGVAIEVAVEHQNDRDVALTFAVSDSGIGITPNDRVRIFEEYAQAEAAPLRRSSGTGLGLAISRAIARSMGGDIVVDSRPGGGSIFQVALTLPIVSPAKPHMRPFSGRQILVASDRSVGATLLMRRLFDLGSSVQWANTEDEVTRLLKSGPAFDAVLVDHSGGIDAVSVSRVLAEYGRPIAVMITPAERPILKQIQVSKLTSHLIKPIRSNTLTKVLAALLTGVDVAGSEAAPVVHGSPQSPARLSILLADDNEINILLGVAQLQSMGHQVESVPSGRAAASKVLQAQSSGRPYDAILMDLHMPEFDGFAAIAAIRSNEQTIKGRTVIIALTADMTAQTADRAVAAGADHVMTKPLDSIKLTKVFSAIGPRHRAEPHPWPIPTDSTVENPNHVTHGAS